MKVPSKLLLSDLLNHNVRCDKGEEHGSGVSVWMHPPVHRLLGWISRPSKFRLQREVWRLDQLKGINDDEVYVKGNSSISDQQTLDRFPTLMNSYVFNKNGHKVGFIADLVFEPINGKILYYLVSRSNPLIPGTSRWRLSISQIIDQQAGSVSCDFTTFEDLPIYKASLKEEFLSKSRKWKTQFEDLTYQASDRLEGWIDEQMSEEKNQTDLFDDSLTSSESNESYNDWIDNFDIDTSEEFNTISSRKNRNSSNANDLDPWI